MEPRYGRALIADDDPVTRQLVYDTLAEAGMEVFTAIDGRQALDTFLAHGPFELLVVDIIMPGMNGTQVVDLIARSSPDARVLYVSARDNVPVLGPGRRFLHKPFTPEQLLEHARALLGS
ncbi:MAG: response regulator transcription factor [Myxococcota bacterium]